MLRIEFKAALVTAGVSAIFLCAGIGISIYRNHAVQKNLDEHFSNIDFAQVQQRVDTSPTPSTSVSSSVPNNVKNVYDAYDTALSELQSNVHLTNSVSTPEGYNLYVIPMDDYKLNFIKTDNADTQNEWWIEFTLDEPQKLKDVFAASFMVTDPSCDTSSARDKGQALANTFSKTALSDIFDSGNYYIYTLSSYDTILRCYNYNLYIKNKDLFTMPDDVLSQYQTTSYDVAVNGIMNKGYKIAFSGSVKTLTLDSANNYNGENFIVCDTYGNEYNVHTYYGKIPHVFDVGDAYTFYGVVTGDDTVAPADIDLEYYK